MGSDSSSSEENSDRQEQVNEDAVTATSAAISTTTTSSKRSYECTFCKRGFTNAQALGGHMNIHRKDRAKTKQVITSSSSPSRKSSEDHMNPNFMGPISNEPISYYPVLEAQRKYNSMYFQPPVGSSSTTQLHPPYSYYHGTGDCLVPSHHHQSSSMNDEQLWGANLSLQIGSNHLDDDDDKLKREVSKEDEVDLELRLGHDR